MSEVQPTHQCFDDALDFFVECHVPGTEFAGYRVVHGICLAPDGNRYAHAWVEHDGLAIQGGIVEEHRIYYAVPIAEFRARWRVQEETRYTFIEALRENHRTGHYGPWVDEYAQLVSDQRHAWEVTKHG